jgi:hypothetical protein
VQEAIVLEHRQRIAVEHVGAMVERPVDMLAHMILGALSEAAMAIARSPHPKKVLKDALREFDILIDGVTRHAGTAP